MKYLTSTIFIIGCIAMVSSDGIPHANCPINNEYYNSFAHESDCNKYYVCDWGKAIEMPCPAGLAFNPSASVCDWQWSAMAGGAVCRDATTERPTQNECPPANEYYHSYAHETDCHKYYVCNWGKGIEMPCATGLVFNTALQVCDWPNNAIAAGAVC